MAIIYRLWQQPNPKLPLTYGKWYARPQMMGTVGIDELAALIEEKCTVHEADVVAVLKSLTGVMKQQIQLGYRVELPGLGTFKPGLSSQGVANQADFDARKHIKRMKIMYVPEKTKDNGHFVYELLRGAHVQDLASLLPKDTTVTGGSSSGDSGGGNNGGSGSDPIEDRP